MVVTVASAQERMVVDEGKTTAEAAIDKGEVMVDEEDVAAVLVQ